MLDADPLVQIALWVAEARDALDGATEVNAMTVATVGADLRPSARMVLLKDLDERGLSFYTNLDSQKAQDLRVHPQAALCLHWLPLYRQIRVVGSCLPVDRAETEAYFASRPRGSQLSAWASHQSAPVADRATLEARVLGAEQRFADADAVPAPPYWGGYRVVPDEVELWQGRPDRTHDRFVYRRAEDGWTVERLQP